MENAEIQYAALNGTEARGRVRLRMALAALRDEADGNRHEMAVLVASSQIRERRKERVTLLGADMAGEASTQPPHEFTCSKRVYVDSECVAREREWQVTKVSATRDMHCDEGTRYGARHDARVVYYNRHKVTAQVKPATSRITRLTVCSVVTSVIANRLQTGMRLPSQVRRLFVIYARYIARRQRHGSVYRDPEKEA